MVPSQRPIQRGTTHLLPVSKSRISGAVLLLPLYTSMACTGKLYYLYTEKYCVSYIKLYHGSVKRPVALSSMYVVMYFYFYRCPIYFVTRKILTAYYSVVRKIVTYDIERVFYFGGERGGGIKKYVKL